MEIKGEQKTIKIPNSMISSVLSKIIELNEMGYTDIGIAQTNKGIVVQANTTVII